MLTTTVIQVSIVAVVLLGQKHCLAGRLLQRLRKGRQELRVQFSFLL